MAIKKYFASKDATISNTFKNDLTYRATGSNCGLSDSLQLFRIYGQASTSSSELARTLMEFPISTISSDRTNGTIPISGSVNFYLCLYNAEHPFSLPRNFYVCVSAITSSTWNEGNGVDDDEWEDDGSVNWEYATDTVSWDNDGSDYFTGSYVKSSTMPSYTSSLFEGGDENLELDITSMVEEWISGQKNYGLCLYLHNSQETALSSSYVKKFFSRSSEYFFKRPTIQARWNNVVNDDRGSFYVSSSLCDTENVNTIYLYNRIRGTLKTIPTLTGSNIYVKIYDDLVSGSLVSSTVFTGGLTNTTGIYSASVTLSTTSSIVYDRWYKNTIPGDLAICLSTGSIKVKTFESLKDAEEPHYIITMPNLKNSYKKIENPRLKVFVKDKNLKFNIYSVVNADTEYSVIKNLYYRIRRTIDKLIVIDYGTGSMSETKISYNVSGSYFDFDMSNLCEDYAYEFNYIYKRPDNTTYEEMPYVFKFRVDKQKN